MSPGAILSLAWSSLNNRRTSAIFTIVAVAVSVMLFLGVDKLRNSARDSFQNTISGTDLIVGARTSPVSLVMFSVFHSLEMLAPGIHPCAGPLTHAQSVASVGRRTCSLRMRGRSTCWFPRDSPPGHLPTYLP